MRRASLAALTAVAIGVLSGCVTPAPTTSAYESKAAMTAEAAVSAARTALLATQAYADGKLQATYLEPTLVDAEDTIGAVSSTFTSIQPPATAAADDLRGQLQPLLDDASSAITEMRIAARRGSTAALTAAAGELATAADDLDAFAAEHGP
jgi:hypothetical protein